MRRIFLTIAFFLFLFSASFFLAPTSFACSINVSPNRFALDNLTAVSPITISSSDCNFQNTSYKVLAYPTNVTSNYELYPTYPVRLPKDSRTLIAYLDFRTQGANNLGQWILKVCAAQASSSDCANNSAYLVAASAVTVISAPGPTLPPTVPRIDVLAQPKCKFQIGETVSLTITSVQPNTNYHWGWDGESGAQSVGMSNSQGSDLPFTVLGTFTNKVGKRKLCVDGGSSGLTGLDQECIWLNFTPGPPPGDTSCSQTNLPSVLDRQNSRLTPTPICGEPTIQPNGSKFYTCDTALGPINTDPVGFVKTIMGFVLGISGGIAVLLIIVSGYKFMASRGNPEAVQAAREQLTSAIVGLLFIIFATAILQIIGYDILRIPGFGK